MSEAPPLPRSFIAAVIVLGLVLTATVVPGVFIVDDDNYLVNVVALRQGHVTVANTAGLTPSRELVFFDPGPEGRAVASTPVSSTAPPLYAPFAVPFSLAGWRGLVALNTLAFLVTIVMVFRYARRYATDALTPWLAAGAFALGGFMIEYAQGVWPHALSIALCTGGVVAIARLIEGGASWLAAVAGLLLAIATGVRYQNAMILTISGVAVLLWSSRRLQAAFAYGLGAIGPVALSAVINHARLGSWNPVSKGQDYLRLPQLQDADSTIFDPLIMFWARLVDFSVRPALVGPGFAWVKDDPVTGAHLIFGQTVQKAFLQSAPWAVLALVAFGMAWVARFDMPPARRRQLRLLSVITTAVLLMFAFSGRHRYEGASYNQRYLLELLPLTAIAFAWALDGTALRLQVLIAGAIWGTLAAVVALMVVPNGTTQLLVLLKFPLLAAVALVAAWIVDRRHPRGRPLLAMLAGVCLGWGLVFHLGSDVIASRRVKGANANRTAALRRALPDHSALVTYWGNRDAAGPLLLERDLIVLDAHADEGVDAPVLIRELLKQNRRVFVQSGALPPAVYAHVSEGLDVVSHSGQGIALTELRKPADAPSGASTN